MTRFNEEQREQLKKNFIDNKIIDLEYDDEGDYYTLILDDNTETSFRFMADISDETDSRKCEI